MADELVVGARLLEEMLGSDPPIWDKADEIKEIEHKCDVLTHQLFQRLHRTFVTPIDREDIHALARVLDDVMDDIDASAGYVRLYRIERVRHPARELARIILASTLEVRQSMEGLELKKSVGEHLVEINRLENEADRVHQQALKELFEEEHNPIEVIKWKELLDLLEDTTDRCEDVADLIEGVVLKHA
jgi:predicted phosphate transport protein (TIGR00153 family)